jgi:glutamine cyclotransferase
MKNWKIVTATLTIAILVLGTALYLSLNKIPAANNTPLNYGFEVVRTFHHDTGAFTEGLVFADGVLYEGTGIPGESELRKVDLETGTVLQVQSLPEYFGEGITVFGNKIIQLTWQSQRGFVYDKDSFQPLEEFSYTGEGWGITNDGNRLIMSNGSATLSFLDPATFKVIGGTQVSDRNVPVTNLNELEYINGTVYANVWQQDKIAIINIQTGQVKAWIDLTGLYTPATFDVDNVLNGIAYDANGGRLFVTGKRWSQLFEIRLVSKP